MARLYWQILPIGPTGYGDSPYQSFSAFAGNPYLIDLDLLIEQELLTRDEAAADFGDNPDAVDYGRLYKNRFDVLRHAARRLGDAPEFAAFCRAQDAWLDEYALYMAIKADCSMNAWYAWPEALRRREPDVLAAARARLSDDVRFWEGSAVSLFQPVATPQDVCKRTRRPDRRRSADLCVARLLRPVGARRAFSNGQ